MHCCHMALSKPGPRFTTIDGQESDLQGEDFLGKEWMMCTGEEGGGDILTILRLKSWKWGLSSADI